MYTELARTCQEFHIREFEVGDRFCTPEHAREISATCPGVTAILVTSDKLVSDESHRRADRLADCSRETIRPAIHRFGV